MAWNRNAFLKSWRRELREAGRDTRFAYDSWEGPIAYRAIKRLELLEVVGFNPGPKAAGYQGWRLGRHLRDLAATVHTYQQSADKLERQRNLLEMRVEPLRSAEKSLGKLMAVPPATDKSLRGVLDHALPEELVNSVRLTRKLLQAEIPKRTQEIEDRLWNFELILWRAILRKISPMADRDWDLESKFQIRIAFLLLRYLHHAAPGPARKLPLSDVSRLVLLFYSAAGLATRDEESRKLRCLRTQKLLSRKIVDQNLTRAGLHTMDFALHRLIPTRGLASE